MTEDENQITSCQQKDDLKLITEYVKNDLYHLVKFIYNEKEDLVEEGPIYEHYKKKLNSLVGTSVTMSADNKETYMKYLWSQALGKHLQCIALSQK